MALYQTWYKRCNQTNATHHSYDIPDDVLSSFVESEQELAAKIMGVTWYANPDSTWNAKADGYTLAGFHIEEGEVRFVARYQGRDEYDMGIRGPWPLAGPW